MIIASRSALSWRKRHTQTSCSESMGYFTHSILFATKPNADRLDEIPDDLGYRLLHQAEPQSWFLEVFRGREYPDFPFTQGEESVLPKSSRDPITSWFSDLRLLFPHIYGDRYITFAMLVAELTDTNVFLFSADDEDLDIGVISSPTGLIRARITFGDECGVPIRADITPQGIELRRKIYDDFEEGDLEASVESLRRCESVTFVTVEDAIQAGESAELYKNVKSLWPPDQEHLREFFGIGTWDPWKNEAVDLETVKSRGETRIHSSQAKKRGFFGWLKRKS